MSTGNRIRSALMALAASLVLFGASSSKATAVLFSGLGFDTSTFPDFDPNITPDYHADSTNTQFMTGFSMGGGAPNDVNVTRECQLLSDGTQSASFCNQELNVTGTPGTPWSSQVEWDLQKDAGNTTGPDGPALILITRLQDFSPGPVQYEPGEVGIVLESADFKVVEYSAGGGSLYYFLAFMVDGIPDFGNGVATVSFEYEVTRDIIGINTNEGGTPILGLVTFAVPEPSSSLLVTVGLLGLAYVGRRRS